jgi:hypothetical protein
MLDWEVTERALLARVLGLKGLLDQAARTAQSAAERALSIGHGLSLCHALAQAACPVALHTGDPAGPRNAVDTLLDTATRQGLRGWIARGRCLLGMVMIAQDDHANGVPLLQDALDDLRESGAAPGYPAFLAELATGLGRAGRVADGLAAIDEAVALADHREERWCYPELLRKKGELHLISSDAAGAGLAEDCFLQALDWASRDGILAWELRASISLARLWRRLGRGRDAQELVARVYGRFTEGFESADLRAARTLI